MLFRSTDNIFNKNGVIKRWVVLSNGRRPALIRHLYLKLIYDELSKQEMTLLQSFKESTSNVNIYFAIKAKQDKIPRRVVRRILEIISVGRERNISREEYLSSSITFSIKEENDPPIKKPKPYRGYSRGYKDGKGSKRTFQVEEFSSSPLTPGPKFEDEVIILLEFAREVSRNPRNNNLLTIFGEFYEAAK